MAGGANDVINVVATRALGPKERLMVVEVADQQLLVGMTAAGSDNTAVLPVGRLVSDQKKLSASPSTSVEPLPSSITVSVTKTVWSGPASATGGARGF